MKSHNAVLEQFFELVNQFGLMFWEKQIHLAQPKIDFWICISSKEHASLNLIAGELLNFPDESLIVKQIQQFLGFSLIFEILFLMQLNILIFYPNFWRKIPHLEA